MTIWREANEILEQKKRELRLYYNITVYTVKTAFLMSCLIYILSIFKLYNLGIQYSKIYKTQNKTIN